MIADRGEAIADLVVLRISRVVRGSGSGSDRLALNQLSSVDDTRPSPHRLMVLLAAAHRGPLGEEERYPSPTRGGMLSSSPLAHRIDMERRVTRYGLSAGVGAVRASLVGWST